MPIGKSGHFSINPGTVRMHDANPPVASKKGEVSKPTQPDPGEQKGHVEVHAGPHEQHPNAKYHTIHHPTGEVKGHQTLHDAHHAVNDHFGGSDGDLHEHGEGSAAEEQNDIGEADAGADEY